MSDNTATLDLAGRLVGRDYDGWPESLRAEMRQNADNAHVGQRLLIESDRLRIWSIRLAPGDRVPFHRHVLDYVWIATSAGSGRQHIHDGSTRDVDYRLDDRRGFRFGPGEFLLHDLENIGCSELSFVTIEHLDSDNVPLPITKREDA